jgi:hypothetical protein
MLAYVFWHRPARGVETDDYERALKHFHHSLAHRPPAGLRGSCTLRAEALPWLPDASGFSAGGYEDWYLVDSWEALGVLEEAAVGHGHHDAHEAAARRYGSGAAAVYRLVEGALEPRRARLAVWVSRPPRAAEHEPDELLADGIASTDVALWRRCLVLGPAPELCLLSAAGEPPGLAPSRLPAEWSAAPSGRQLASDG